MRLFRCAACDQLLYFENRRCEKCGHDLGYIAEMNELAALEPDGDAWQALGQTGGRYRFCANAAHDACNWLVPEEEEGEFCLACRHNRIVPDLAVPENLRKWRKVEMAKHRLVYSLVRLNLPLESNEDREGGLCFDFLADAPDGSTPRVMTGHDEGLITIALAEADDAEREQRKSDLGELYRTLLGHFRHEVGHYYWNRLVRDAGRLEAFRAVFGDETADYGEALKTYYSNGPLPDWQSNFVSAYATAHPWEDFAETFKHYVHIVDTLEMAAAFGIQVHPGLDSTGELGAEVDFNPYQACPVQQMVDSWLPMSFALNNLNRCLGMSDAYPFILGPGVIQKLGFIHRMIHRQVEADPVAASTGEEIPPGRGKNEADAPEGKPEAA
ncbi:putative zinc-binding peptidase [Xanthobacter dioxanivorans]|uniref:Zinc-binding peptidase n=1 Tax=Xanthobacter dioxanivorans TaxID=2528964 RepID=A0A974SHJ7_9HYPH|nr:putative zinc-binding peptidase [Xanthobacter dioxanivorans]QRG05184.1 putative zinc-binding peptidase [Xanthobacter dioxanivorans]